MTVDEANRQRLEYNEIISYIAGYITMKFQKQSIMRIYVYPYTLSMLCTELPKYKNFIKFRFSPRSSRDVSKKKMLKAIEKEFKLKPRDSILDVIIDYRSTNFTYYLPEDKFDALYALIKLKGNK